MVAQAQRTAALFGPAVLQQFGAEEDEPQLGEPLQAVAAAAGRLGAKVPGSVAGTVIQPVISPVIQRAIGGGKSGAKVVLKTAPSNILTAQLQADGINYRLMGEDGAEVAKDISPNNDSYDLAPGVVATATATPSATDVKKSEAPPPQVVLSTAVSSPPILNQAMVDKIGCDTLEGAMLAGTQILNAYPPGGFIYIGVGQSPALVTAYLASRGCEAFTVPLSSFKHSAMTPFGRADPLDAQKETALGRHFDQYLPKPAILKGRGIAIIDFVMQGSGAIAAYNYIHRYYLGGEKECPVGDAFLDDNVLADRWNWDDSGMADLQIKLAILCARSNRGDIQKVVNTNATASASAVAIADDEKQFPGLGRLSRLAHADYLLVSPGDPREDTLMGRLDGESLKSYSEFGKQSASLRVSRDSYKELVMLFSQYQPRKPIHGTSSGGSAGSAAAEQKEKLPLPSPESLFDMLQRGIGISALAIEPMDAKEGKRTAVDAVGGLPPLAPRVPPPPAVELPVDRIAKIIKAINTAMPLVNGDVLMGTAATAEVRTCIAALHASLQTAATIEQLIAALTGLPAKLEAIAKPIPRKVQSRGIAEDIATRVQNLLANAIKRQEKAQRGAPGGGGAGD